MKLKYLIPLLGLMMSVVLIIYQFQMLSTNLKDREIAYSEKLLRNMANNLQGELNDHIAADNRVAIQRNISGVSLLSVTREAYLLDEKDQILASGDFAQIGKHPKLMSDYYDQAMFEQVRRSMSGTIQSKPSGNIMISVYPIIFGRDPGELRPNRIGLSVIVFDLTFNLQQVKNSVLAVTFKSAVVVGLILLAGVLAIHMFLTKRVQGILDAAKEYTSGISDARSTVSGSDELGKISRAFNAVADTAEHVKGSLESRERSLSNAQRLAHLGSWVWDISTGEETWSEEQFRIFGYDPKTTKATYEAFLDRVHPDDRSSVEAAVGAALDNKTDCSFQHRIVRFDDGKERFIEWHGELILDAQGAPSVMQGTVLDMTDRHRAEQEIKSLNENLEHRVAQRTTELQTEMLERQNAQERLKEAEAKTRQIINSAVDGIITTDDKGKILSFNTAAEKIFGYSVFEAVGQNITTLMPANHAEHHASYMKNYMETGGSEVVGMSRELVAKHKDNSTFLVDFSVSVFRHGDTVTFVGIARDITERKEAEYQLNTTMQELKESQSVIAKNEQRLRDILDSSTGGITVVMKDDLHRVYANERLLDMFSVKSIDELEAFGFDNTFANHKDYDEVLGLLKTTGQCERFVCERVCKDGKKWWALQDAHSIVFEGKPAIIVWIYDITDQKHAEEELLQAKKMASLGGLVAGVAHEINTPIGISVTASSHLQEATQNLINAFAKGEMRKSDLDKYLTTATQSTEMIGSNLKRASGLISSFKKVSVDQSNDEDRTFKILDYVDEVLLSLSPKFRGKNIQVKTRGDRDIEITTNPGAVSQVLTNLVMNSLIHGFEDKTEGAITISAHHNHHKIMLNYCDDGKGMDDTVRANVFEPFYTTKRNTGGSGLGMHILYNLITQSLGGGVTCKSAPGQGTQFDITIPQKQEKNYESRE